MRSGRFGVVFLWTTVALAGEDGERAALARVIHEIDALKPLIAEAEAQANPDARVKFHYPWLKQDLDYIKLGIREHIETPRSEPRSFPPLKGDYRRQIRPTAIDAASSAAFVQPKNRS